MKAIEVRCLPLGTIAAQTYYIGVSFAGRG